MTERLQTFDLRPLLDREFNVALIIKQPTGVFYTNQVGGVNCLNPEIEGRVSYLTADTGRLCEMYEFEGFEKITDKVHGITVEDAAAINAACSKLEIPFVVDMNLLGQSHEAWIHGLLHYKGITPPKGIESQECLLTYSSSD